MEKRPIDPESRRRAQRLGVAIAIGVVALVGYWWSSYSGPYRWLAEWQLRAMGRYFAELTALVVLVGTYVVLFGVCGLVDRVRPGTFALLLTPQGKPSGARPADAPKVGLWPTWLLLVGVMFLGWAIFFAVVGKAFLTWFEFVQPA